MFIFHATPIKATNLLTLTRSETFSTTEWFRVLDDGFRPVQAHLMLFISDTDPLGGLTATVTASREDFISDNCEIAHINTV
jgi:hypothetical protein